MTDSQKIKEIIENCGAAGEKVLSGVNVMSRCKTG